MSIIDTLITDRTEADVQRWSSLKAKGWAGMTNAEKAEWAASLKGSYNYTDLNRVTEAMDYLNEQLVGYGYATGYQKIKIPRKGSGRLPEGYTELEYIQSNGQEYVDTGFKPNQDTRVVMDLRLLQQTTATVGLFGARDSSSSTANNKFNFWSMNTGASIRSDYFGSTNQTASISIVNQRITVDKNKNVCSVGDTTLTNSISTGQCNFNLTLFGVNSVGTVSYRGAIAVYSSQVYDNGTLIRDFAPCTNASGTVGLYDLVGGEFYQNAGTGTFTAGPEIPPEPGEVLDPYTWYEPDIPTPELMTAYLSNVEAIRSTLEVMATTPETPESMEALTWVGANNIEQILVDVETVINRVVNAMARSNSFTFWSGNRPFPTAESNLGRNWAELDAMDTEWTNWQVATWYLLLYGNLEAEGVVS